VLEQAERGRLPLDKLITNTFLPHEVDSVLSALADGNKQMVGVIFDWQTAD
jgi:hypothetical protein